MERRKNTRYGQVSLLICWGLISVVFILGSALGNPVWASNHFGAPSKGSFLVATEKLDQSSFRQTVIFITHYSNRGATGIAINRSAKIPLEDAFPHQKKLHGIKDLLFLGGPVRTDAVFVLMQTSRPHAGMRNITDNIYFTVGIEAITHGIPNIVEGEYTRAYMGYAGWAPGQLQAEINRGDWLVIDAEPSIIFEMDHKEIWKKLYSSWSGRWI